MEAIRHSAKPLIAVGCVALATRYIIRYRSYAGRLALAMAVAPPSKEDPAPLQEAQAPWSRTSEGVVIELDNCSSNCLDEQDDDLNESVVLSGGDAFPPSLVDLWHGEVMCDLEAHVGGVSFAAHRMVLAAGSAVLRKLYSTPLKTGNTGGESCAQLTINNLDAEAFRAMLVYLYTGACELPSARLLVPVLEAAARLQISSLQDSAADAISNRLLPANCLGAWALAEEYQLGSLEVAARAEALRAFEALLSGGAMAGLPYRQLCTLLDDDSLRTMAEERVFEAVVSWHSAQRPPPSTKLVVDVLARVRFPLMDPKFVRESVMSSPLMQSLEAKDVLATALLAEMAGQVLHVRVRPLCCIFTNPLSPAQVPRHTRRRLCAASIYIAGGMSGSGPKPLAVERLSNSSWLSASQMSGVRVGACSGVLDGRLFVVGGTANDDETLSSVEVTGQLHCR